jgi:hypothetical protein
MFWERKSRPPLVRSKALTCLLVNALVCPGLGSLMARRLSGLPQLALAWGGAVWIIAALVQCLTDWFHQMEMQPDWQGFFHSAWRGLVLLLVGWLWSVLTGLWLLYHAKAPVKEPVPGPSRTPDANELGGA